MPFLQWSALAATSLLIFGNAADGLSVVYPEQTAGHLEDIYGRSPLPTHPPDVPADLPKELAKRKDILPYPPKPYICGVVDNNIGE